MKKANYISERAAKLIEQKLVELTESGLIELVDPENGDTVCVKVVKHGKEIEIINCEVTNDHV